MPVVALVAMFMLWRLPKRGEFRTRFMWVPLLYCGWVVTSFAWSAAPGTTGKRLVVFLIDAGFTVALARTFSVMEMAGFGFVATTTVAMISLYVDVLQERVFAPFDADYRFMGVMTANYQAMNLVVSMLCALTLAQRRPQWLKWFAPLIGLELVLLYLTRSRLGAVICIVLLSVMAMRLVRERMKPEMRALALVAGLMVVAPAMIYVLGEQCGRRGAECVHDGAQGYGEYGEPFEPRAAVGGVDGERGDAAVAGVWVCGFLGAVAGGARVV